MISTPVMRLRIIKIIVISSVLPVIFAGCAMVVPKERLTEEQSHTLGNFYALVGECHEAGSYAHVTRRDYHQVVEDILDISNFDKDEFYFGVADVVSGFAGENRESIMSECDQNKGGMEDVYVLLLQRHLLVKSERTAAWVQIAKKVVSAAL